MVGGIGGGSDCVQAAQLSLLLKESRKNVPAIFSVRTLKTTSQGADGKMGENRTPKGAEEISPGVFLIKPGTEMKGRSVESAISGDIPTYLILIQDEHELTEQIESLKKYLGNIDTIIGVDTGGDALYSTTGHDQAKATPDQDIEVLKAINKMTGVNTLSCEIAIGVDTPPNGQSVLELGKAKYYEPSENEVISILKRYQGWEMDGSNDKRFGKTPLSWQKALQGKYGFQAIDLPKRVVLDPKNPWNPFVNIQESTRGLFFMKTNNHIKAIS